MNPDITLDEFIANLVTAAANFREIANAGWADRTDCPPQEWQRRMDQVAHTTYPGDGHGGIKPKWQCDKEA
jgi:hypothetical protein